MTGSLVKVNPDRERVKSILSMVNTTLNMISCVDNGKFTSNVTKEYYEVIRELMTAVLLLDGYKTVGEGAHKALIDYLRGNYSTITLNEILLINNLRITRNKVCYEGFLVKEVYLRRKVEAIQSIIYKLKEIINEKLG